MAGREGRDEEKEKQCCFNKAENEVIPLMHVHKSQWANNEPAS